MTRARPSPEQLETLEFAWALCKHVRSNAIVLAQPGPDPGSYESVGIGGGQTARLLAVEIACTKAGAKAAGSVLASDAFFPFPDGLETAARAGVRAVAQPGGSKNDEAVIRAADAAGVAMVFTGTRHFRH